MSNRDFSSVSVRTKGRLLEDFEAGQKFEHHWGRTVLEADSMLFTTMTLGFNPLYLNREYAAQHGHPGLVVNPFLVFSIVFGLSVEDLSETGGPLLSVDNLEFNQPVYAQDTLTATSEVISVIPSKSRLQYGIVTWRTEGRNQKEMRVVTFTRSNLVRRRETE